MSTLSYTYNLTAGTPARAAEVMQNFNDARAVINGNVGPTNVDLTATYPWTGTHSWEIAEAKISGPTVGVLIPIDYFPQGLINIAFAQGSDSSQLKITSSTGAALGATNPGYVRVRSSTAGTYRTFSVTADVTIDLTGAHWGLDTKGNVTGAILRVYAIDDNGSLRWGVGYQGGFYYIRNSQDDATATNINLPEEILVNSGVGTDNSPMRDVGWILANFTDATNEWAITEYHPNESADGVWQPWNPAPTGFSGTPTVNHASFTQFGKSTLIMFDITGTSNATSFGITLPFKSQNTLRMGAFRETDNAIVDGQCADASLTASSATVALNQGIDVSSNGWTGSGTKAVTGQMYFSNLTP